MKKVYLAGPQVFLPNAAEVFAQATDTCLEHDLVPLVPLNTAFTTPQEIFEFNKTLIRQADYVLADVTPFRGSEPDSGTAWEIGFAHALGKSVFMYSLNAKWMRAKALEHFQLNPYDKRIYFPDGMCAETFGSPTNLMLSHSALFILGSFEQAVQEMTAHLKQQIELGKDKFALAT